MPTPLLSTRLKRAFLPTMGGRRRTLVLGAIPPNLRPADEMFHAEWADGRFALAGSSIVLAGRTPFEIVMAPDAWTRALYEFAWLRHVAAASGSDAALHMEALVADWLTLGRRRNVVADVGAVVARRVLSWLAHADMLLQTDDAVHYDAVLEALNADIRRLESTTRATPTTAADAAARVLGLIALVQAGLCMDDDRGLTQRAATALASALEEAKAAASIWRTPDALASLLVDLETLRRLYRMLALPVPPFVAAAVARMARVLGGLMLGCGQLARLGTARGDIDAAQSLALTVRHCTVPSGAAALPTLMDGQVGFVRLVAGETCVVADTGAPVRAEHALELEMSTGDAPLLVHDGDAVDAPRSGRGVLVFGGAVRAAGSVLPVQMAPTLEPTHTVTVELAGPGPLRFDATHAGHAGRGLVHRRRVSLGPDGTLLEGVDELRPLAGTTEPDAAHYALRFVVHPSVAVRLGAATDQVHLKAANGHVWTFSAPGHTLSIDGDVYRDGRAIQETLQILVLGDVAASRTVAWSLRRGHDSATDRVDETEQARTAHSPARTLAQALADVRL